MRAVPSQVVGSAWTRAGVPLGRFSSAGYLRSSTGPFADVFRALADVSWLPWLDLLMAWGLLLVGLSLMLGLFTQLACAGALLDAGDAVYPMFASHNAHTVAWVAAYAAGQCVADLEFQRLHGMGESLYAQVCAPPHGHACRVYAPVGSHEDLLPSLVRRLLENGANTSFVHRIADPSVSIADIVADPADLVSVR